MAQQSTARVMRKDERQWTISVGFQRVVGKPTKIRESIVPVTETGKPLLFDGMERRSLALQPSTGGLGRGKLNCPKAGCGPEVDRKLENRGKSWKRIQLNQLLRWWSRCKLCVLQHPGVLVKQEDRVHPGRKCRIDVTFRTIADHPGRMGL